MTLTWQELIDEDDAIQLVTSWHERRPGTFVICPAAPVRAQRVLESLQVSTRSGLGAVAFHTGGILIQDGWLRLLGCGSEAIPRALDEWNGLGHERRCEHGLLVADDAVGGFFCWSDASKTIRYLAPDTLEWEDLEVGYTDWLEWCFGSGLEDFYRDFRWDSWRQEVAALEGYRALHILPPLFTKGPPIGERSRRPVPVEELWGMTQDFASQLR